MDCSTRHLCTLVAYSIWPQKLLVLSFWQSKNHQSNSTSSHLWYEFSTIFPTKGCSRKDPVCFFPTFAKLPKKMTGPSTCVDLRLGWHALPNKLDASLGLVGISTMFVIVIPRKNEWCYALLCWIGKAYPYPKPLMFFCFFCLTFAKLSGQTVHLTIRIFFWIMELLAENFPWLVLKRDDK